MSVGCEALDDDHKEILLRVNRFLEAAVGQAGVSEIHARFRGLEQVVHRHFATEENLLRQAAYENLDYHMKAHAQLADELEDFWNRLLADPDLKPDPAMVEWLESWLVRHVEVEDFQYRPAIWRLQGT